MGDGFVFHFSNPTFADFFREELYLDIDRPRWEAQGGSKAKRPRYYLLPAYRRTAQDTLNALWEYREISSVTHDKPGPDDTAVEPCSTRKPALCNSRGFRNGVLSSSLAGYATR